MEKENIKPDLTFIQEQLIIESIDDDFALLNDISKVPFFDYPTKVDYTVAGIFLKGYVEGGINLKPCTFYENDLFILLPGQIVQYTYASKDVSGLYIIMSKRFTDNLEFSIKESIPIMLHLRENPIMHLIPEEMEHIVDYYSILQKAVRMKHNPNRMEMVRLLVQAFFYGVNDFQQFRQGLTQKSKREELFDSFYNLVLQHYKDSREVGFYADKLCLTPKYLSKVIKDVTGKSAFDWINDYVILEAKSLLKSTNMTIQQIGDELNFANQSFFGKYFKQHVGMSPKEYRGK